MADLAVVIMFNLRLDFSELLYSLAAHVFVIIYAMIVLPMIAMGVFSRPGFWFLVLGFVLIFINSITIGFIVFCCLLEPQLTEHTPYHFIEVIALFIISVIQIIQMRKKS